MKLLEGKVALITGGTRGIGKAIAMKYASEGANIAFTYVSNSEVAKQVEEEITAMGVTCKGVCRRSRGRRGLLRCKYW